MNSVKSLANQLDAKNPMAQVSAAVKEVATTVASLFQPQAALNFNYA